MDTRPKEVEAINPKAINSMYRNPLAAGVNRNIPCPCGSGKKTKKCHGRDYSVTRGIHDNIIKMINEYNVRLKTAFQEQAKKAIAMENQDGPQTKRLNKSAE